MSLHPTACIDDIPSDVLYRELKRREELISNKQCPYCQKLLTYTEHDGIMFPVCTCKLKAMVSNYHRKGIMGPFTTAAVDLFDVLTDLIREQSIWSQATFGSDTVRGPIGPLKHLEKEVKEAYEAAQEIKACEIGISDFTYDKAKEAFQVELADCLLLLLDSMRRGKVKLMDLIRTARKKLEVNKSRKWNTPASETDFAEHVREVEPRTKEHDYVSDPHNQ